MIHSTVSVSSNWFAVIPRAISAKPNVVLEALGTSPLHANEYATAYSLNHSPRYEHVNVDLYPAHQNSGIDSHLCRIAFARQGNFSEQQFFLIPGEAAGYRGDELSYQVTPTNVSGVKVTRHLICLSPGYYWADDRKKVPFRGEDTRRVLWELEFHSYTNFECLVVPASFTYTRYQDVSGRTDRENKVPIVVLDAVVRAFSTTGLVSLSGLLAETLNVHDARAFKELGGEWMFYTVGAEGWPAVGSAEYQRIVDKGKAELAGLARHRWLEWLRSWGGLRRLR